MISKLVSRLQNEVRAERATNGPTLKFLSPTAELEPATPSTDSDYESFEPGFDLPRWQPSWSDDEQTAKQTN